MDRPIERPPPRPVPRFLNVLLICVFAVLAATEYWKWQHRQRNQTSTWDGGPIALLTYKEGQHGEILLPAQADNIDVGPCLLDSGATALTISPAAARKAKLGFSARLPWSSLRGVMGGSTGFVPNRTARELRVGPVGIERPILTELPERHHSVYSLSGAPYQTVCSKDIFHAAVVDIDWRSRQASFYKPGSTPGQLEGLSWIPLTVLAGRPYMKIRFGRHEGLFLIDTGMNYAIHFHRHAVEEFELLGARASIAVEASGIGGSGTVRMRWMNGLQFGEHQLGPTLAGFDTEHRHRSDRPVAGMIGRDLLRHFRTIIDLPNKRAAFIAYEPGEQAPLAK